MCSGTEIAHWLFITTVTIGNGGTNEGEFHEGLNMASVRKWPLVTVVM
ncbi:thiamine pyrophosphate-dependent enzyme, partial [Mycoplasmopsis bovis]